MPRKSESDSYQKFLDPKSVELLEGKKEKSPHKPHPGRPKKDEVDGSSPFLGRLVSSGKITKNNLKKPLELKIETVQPLVINSSIKPDKDYFDKDNDYDYEKANESVVSLADKKVNESILNMSPKEIETLSQNAKYEKLPVGEKDQLGFGIKNEQLMTGNPFDLGLGEILETQKLDKEVEKPKSDFSLDQLDKLGNLKYLISDLLSGDSSLIEDPSFKTLGLANVKLAIEWLLNNQGLTNSGMQGLLVEPWRLVYRIKPPTMEEFLTEKYIGPDADTLYPWVRKMLIDSFDPTKPYRNLILYYFIGGGKSTASVMANTYISLCNSLMWNQFKYYGHAQPVDALVETPKGPKTIGEIQVGDIVSTPTGESEVVQLHPQGQCEVYQLELEDGRTVECNIHHMFKCTYQKDNNGEDIWEVVELKEILEHPEREYFIPDLF